MSYYNIVYVDRIGQLAAGFAALTDPANADYVTRCPCAADQAALFANANGPFQNLTGAPFNPTAVAAIVDFRKVNVARQDIDGIDLLVKHVFKGARGELRTSLNGTYEQVHERVTNHSAETQLAGRAFSPPRFRGRAGATWSMAALSTTLHVNFLGSSHNTFRPDSPEVASWTTFDGNVSYTWPSLDLKATASILNILDKNPPYVDTLRTGFTYDPVNTTPLGRFVSIGLAKTW